MTEDWRYHIAKPGDPPIEAAALVRGTPLHIDGSNADQYRHIIGDSLADMFIQWAKEEEADAAAGIVRPEIERYSVWRTSVTGTDRQFLGRFGSNPASARPNREEKSGPSRGEAFGQIFKSR